MNRRVAIVGIGQSPRDPRYNRRHTWREILVSAVYEALDGAGIGPREIQAGFVNYHGEMYIETGGIAPIIADYLGMTPISFSVLSAQCNGGALSLYGGITGVVSGRYDKVLVIGFDKEDTHINPQDTFNTSFEVEYDYNLGLSHLDGIFLREQAYMRKYGYDLRPVAKFAQQCYWYANRNPRAVRYKEPVPGMEELTQEIWPGSLMPALGSIRKRGLAISGGAAAAVILVPEEDAHKYTDVPVFVDGFSHKVISHYLGKQQNYPVPGLKDGNIASLPHAAVAAREAYAMAGITFDDIDLAHVYDNQATPMLFLEALGICEPGRAGQFILDGGTAVDGRCPTNTHGGCTAFCLSSGADVTDQIVESVIQLQGRAGERQVKEPRVAVCCGFSGCGGGTSVTVLKRS